MAKKDGRRIGGRITPSSGVRKPGMNSSENRAKASQEAVKKYEETVLKQEKQIEKSAKSTLRTPGMIAKQREIERMHGQKTDAPINYDYSVFTADTSSESDNRTKRKKSRKKKKKEYTKEQQKFRKSNKKRRKKVALFIIILLLLVLVVGAASYASYTFMIDRIKNPVTLDSIVFEQDTTQKFRVGKSESTESIANRLYDLGLIQNATVYRALSKINGYDGQYKAGTYTISAGLSYEEIMLILSGNPETVKITFPEGFTTLQIAARLEANGLCTQKDFLDAVQNVDISSYAFLHNLDTSSRDYRLDGYLFPDTYEFDIQATPDEIIYKMLNRFSDIFKPAYYPQLETLGYSMDEVVIMASLVEKEAKLDSDRAKIAGVFYNRLKSDSKDLSCFQSCATVRYVYKKLYEEDLINITKENEQEDDPYNTYLYPGFTPGPICSPGEASLIAALFPEEHTFYYFVAKTDGSNGHVFTSTYAEHLEAQAEQQRIAQQMREHEYEDEDE